MRKVLIYVFPILYVIDIDLYVTLEYGVSLPAVAQNAKSNVKYRVEEMTGVTVHTVNVHVENIRV